MLILETYDLCTFLWYAVHPLLVLNIICASVNCRRSRSSCRILAFTLAYP
jgi:hypothetical protein